MLSLPDRPKEIFKRLNKYYKKAAAEGGLNFENPFQLLIATILSAQCTDERVNRITPLLFQYYPTPKALSKAPLAKVEELIRSINFYRTKAKNIIGTSKILGEKFKGEVPKSMNDLLLLPGVGRKTANVVLSYAFNLAMGIPVETHVIRVTRLLGLTKESDPKKIEQDLMRQFPRRQWTRLTPLLISLGQDACVARRKQCFRCPLRDLCPSLI